MRISGRDPVDDQDVKTIVAFDEHGTAVILAEDTEAWVGTRDPLELEDCR